MESAFSGPGTIGISWLVLLAFLRLSTKAAVFEHALDVDDALNVAESWLDQPGITIVSPTERHPAVMRELLHPLGTGGNLVNDAHLAALAIEHGAEIISFDSDFSRFQGVRWSTPAT